MSETEKFEEKLREHCNIEYNKYDGEEQVNTHLSAVLIAFDEYLKADDANTFSEGNITDVATSSPT